MAIIIPSKNIYNINNPKIRDNSLNAVTVKQTVVSPHNEFDTNVYNESFDAKKAATHYTQNPIPKDIKSNLVGSTELWQSYNVAVSSIIGSLKYVQKTIKIPILSDNYYINSLKLGKDENGSPNIKVSHRGTIKKGSAIGDVTLTGLSINNVSVGVSNPTINTTEENVLINYASMSPITNPVQLSGSNIANVSISLALGNLSEITTANYVVENGIEYYMLSLSILSNLSIYKISLIDSYTLYFSTNTGSNTQTFTDLPVVYEEYIPDTIEVTFYGNTIGISLDDGSVTYGSGNNPYSLEGNELIQNSAKVNNKSLTQHLADNILSQYNKGKETATLLCSISDYYDESGTLLIGIPKKQEYSIYAEYDNGLGKSTITIYSYGKYYPFDLSVKIEYQRNNGNYGTTEIILASGTTENSQTLLLAQLQSVRVVSVVANVRMNFKLHDKVIPMINNSDGYDKPLSYYEDGTPKVFDVVGSNIIYDGAVWQELTLQEVIISNT